MRFFYYISWFVAIFFALCLAGIAFSYFDFDLNKGFLGSKQEMIGNSIWMSAFYLHLLFGGIATLVGIPLFFSKLISFTSKVHKQLGKLYIFSILFIGGPTGLYLSFFAEGGKWASIGFILMSAAWMFPTYMAFKKIIDGKIERHYHWVIRSYCMTLSGVTLRLFTPIGSSVFEFDYETNFIISAYLPWMINLALAEVLVQLNKRKFKQLHLS